MKIKKSCQIFEGETTLKIIFYLLLIRFFLRNEEILGIEESKRIIR